MKNTIELIKVSDIVKKSNHRETFTVEELKELAASIKQNGLLQPIGVRKIKNELQLIFGERRYRAHLILQEETKGFEQIRAQVYEGISDEEVLELQLIENLQRQDVHPMEEAKAFKSLITKKGKSVQDIALHIGKTASYVAQRLKLNDLYVEFQNAFRGELMTLKTALAICKISVADQEDFWKESFADDKENECLESIEVNEHDLRTYLNDLNNAPFDTDDTKLTKASSCGSCPFNTAANSLLFPEMADKATCTKSQCFREKAKTTFDREIKQALEQPDIEFIVTHYSDFENEAIELINNGHKVYHRNSISIMEEPEEPVLAEYEEDFQNENFDSEEEMKTAFAEAVEEYKKDIVVYEASLASGKFIKAFIVEGNGKGSYVYITFKKEVQEKTSAKGVQEKIKNGNVNKEDVKNEIKRLQEKEKRSCQLDEEKTQPLFYELLLKNEAFASNTKALEREEKAAMLIMFAEYAGYTLDKEFYKSAGLKNDSDHNHANLFKALIKLEVNELDTIFQVLVRKAILNKLNPNKGTRPDNSGKAAALKAVCSLYDNTGLENVWNAQMETRTKRELRLEQRVTQLNNLVKEPKKK